MTIDEINVEATDCLSRLREARVTDPEVRRYKEPKTALNRIHQEVAAALGDAL